MSTCSASVFSLDPADHDVEAALTRLGRGFVKFICRPGAMSPLRKRRLSPISCITESTGL